MILTTDGTQINTDNWLSRTYGDSVFKPWQGEAFGYKTLGFLDDLSPKCFAPTVDFDFENKP